MRLNATGFVLMLMASSAASAATVSASASFSGGLLGSWSFNFAAADPGIFLQQVKIDLSPGTNLAFDTAPASFGSLASQNVGGFAGTAAITGLTSFSPLNPALDGQTELIFNFADFNPGELFTFNVDVDHPDPVLIPLVSCAGKTGFALAACIAQNIGITATNDANLLAAQTVLPNAIAGATVTFVFGGTGYSTTTSTVTFDQRTLVEILRGQTDNVAAANVDVAAPEPGTIALMLIGLAAVAVRWDRRFRLSARRTRG